MGIAFQKKTPRIYSVHRIDYIMDCLYTQERCFTLVTRLSTVPHYAIFLE